MKHLKIFIIVLVVVSLIPLIILAKGDKGEDKEMAEEVITLRIVWENWGADFTKYLDGDWTEKYEADHPNIKLEWLFPASLPEKALEWLFELVDYYGYEELLEFQGAYAEWSGASPDHPFILGNATFDPNGWWNYEILTNYAPDLDYGIINFPTLTGASSEKSNWVVMGWSVAIPKGAPHPDEAWEFLKYSWYDFTAEFGALTINSPSVKKSFPRFEELVNGQFGADNKIAQVMPMFDEIGIHATKSMPTTPAGEFFDTELQRAVEMAMSHQMTAQEALDNFTERVQLQIDRAVGK